MEDVYSDLFGCLPVGRESHDQSEDGAMSPLVERVQRQLVARSYRLDERRQILLRHRSLGLGIEHVAQCCWLSRARSLGLSLQISHWRVNFSEIQPKICEGNGR